MTNTFTPAGQVAVQVDEEAAGAVCEAGEAVAARVHGEHHADGGGRLVPPAPGAHRQTAGGARLDGRDQGQATAAAAALVISNAILKLSILSRKKKLSKAIPKNKSQKNILNLQCFK